MPCTPKELQSVNVERARQRPKSMRMGHKLREKNHSQENPSRKPVIRFNSLLDPVRSWSLQYVLLVCTIRLPVS